MGETVIQGHREKFLETMGDWEDEVRNKEPVKPVWVILEFSLLELEALDLRSDKENNWIDFSIAGWV